MGSDSAVKISEKITGQACAAACALRKKTDHSILGATVRQDGEGGCWCERGTTYKVKHHETYKTCLLKGYFLLLLHILLLYHLLDPPAINPSTDFLNFCLLSEFIRKNCSKMRLNTYKNIVN